MSTQRLSITLPKGLYDQIAELAEQSNRSKSGQIVHLLNVALGEYSPPYSLTDERWQVGRRKAKADS